MIKSSVILRKTIPAALGIYLILLLSVQSFSAAAISKDIHAQGTIVFTPNITPVNATGMLAPTVPSALNQPPVPTPGEKSGPSAASVDTPDGLITLGYDFVKDSDPPLWLIWYGDEGFFINPDDASTAALLSAFREEVQNVINATNTIDDATRDLDKGGIA